MHINRVPVTTHPTHDAVEPEHRGHRPSSLWTTDRPTFFLVRPRLQWTE